MSTTLGRSRGSRGQLVMAGVVGLAVLPFAVVGHPNPNAFPNCTAMHAKYPHGVGRVGAVDHTTSGRKPVTNFYRSTAIYNLNTARDADHDGIACEQR